MAEIKEWVSVFASSASGLAALIALGVSLWVANAQRRIQMAQLQQNLFDKRYNIFLAVEEFLMYVLRTDGLPNLVGDEFRRFRNAAEQAQFLFDSDVVNYMNRIDKTVRGLYVRCRERDHLATTRQDTVALDGQITQAIIDLEGPVLEDRKRVFRPYLQLSRSAMLEGGAAPMKLNGWQRLWILATAIWLLSVLMFSYTLWPTISDIPKAAVFARLKPWDCYRLIGCYQPSGVTLDMSKAVPIPAPVTITPDVPGSIVDVDGHTLQFVEGLSPKDVNQTADAYRAVLRHILELRRASFGGEAFALWIVPALALYMLGWAIAWVWRGFGTRPRQAR